MYLRVRLVPVISSTFKIFGPNGRGRRVQVLSAMRTWNAWFALSSQAALLGLEAQGVMALRFIRFAAGGPVSRSEKDRMVTEKVQALAEAQTAAANATMRGANSRQVAKKVLGVYKKRVRRNRRRLSK